MNNLPTQPQGQRPLNILLADDGSEHVRAAIFLLRDLPLPPKSAVTALGVLTPRESSNYAVLQAALDATKALLEEKGIATTTLLQLGYPSEILVDYAHEHQPDLIIMGAKGLRATLGILLGGVAQQVVEYADSPVLIVRAPYTGIQPILLVTDGSPFSQQAVEYLAGTSQMLAFPLPPQTEVHVVHVLPPIPSPDFIARSWPLGPEVIASFSTEAEADSTWLKEEKRQGEAILEKAVKDLSVANLQVHPALLRGDAATEIISYVKSHQIKIVVAGCRGLSPAKGRLLGSVARKLVHYAGCSVLVVKGKHAQ